MKCRSAGTPQPIDYTLDPLQPELIIQLPCRRVEENVLSNATILNTPTVVVRVTLIPKNVHRHLNTHLFWLYSAATRRQRITERTHQLSHLRRIGGGFSPVDAMLAIVWAGPAANTQYRQLSSWSVMAVSKRVYDKPLRVYVRFISIENRGNGNIQCQPLGVETQRQLAKYQYLNSSGRGVPHTKVRGDKKTYRHIPVDIVEQLRKG